jgi:hypothetical protein
MEVVMMREQYVALKVIAAVLILIGAVGIAIGSFVLVRFGIMAQQVVAVYSGAGALAGGLVLAAVGELLRLLMRIEWNTRQR